MAVKLRLRREGTVKRPHYRIVAADSRSPRDGRFIETIGNYHPLDQPSTINVDNERALHWLRNGAVATSAVEKLLRISGAWEAFKPGDAPTRVRTDKVRLSKKARARAAEAAEAAAAPAPAVEEAPAAEAAAEDAPVAEPAAEPVVEDAPAEAPAAEAAPADEAPADEEKA
jgi:small subunit ribosomal protein S16